MTYSLDGQVALVTGGTKGIGKSIADKFANLGAKVIVTARSESAEPIPHQFIAGDLSKPAGAAAITDVILQQYGSVDIIVNNAGGNSSPAGGYGLLTDEHWENEIQLNLMSAVRINRALLPAMVVKQSGVIINVSTGAAIQPLWDVTMPYSASKAALNAYSKALATEVASKGVRVNTVSPGVVRTPAMTDFIANFAKNAGLSIEDASKLLLEKVGGVPVGRMAEPEEIANLIAFLVSPEAKYITGVNYRVDGGTVPVVI